MFSLETSKLSDEQIKEISERDSASMLKVAIKANGMRYAQKFWPDVGGGELDSESYIAAKTILRLGRAGKGFVGLRSVYESLRKIKPFEGCRGVMPKIKNAIIPELDKLGVVCLIGDRVFVNPRIIERGEFEKRFKVSQKEREHEQFTEQEIADAIELLRMMRKINEAIK